MLYMNYDDCYALLFRINVNIYINMGEVGL